MDLRDIAARCESLGRNCEFGLVQRRLGLEPMGLLRWAATMRESLIRGLRTEFAGIGRDMELWIAAGEWWGRDAATGLEFHAHAPQGRHEAEVRAQEARRLPRLAEKLLEDIRNGDKVLVYSSAELTDPTDAYDLLDAIRHIGSGPVLIVAQGSAQPPRRFDHNAWGASLPRLTAMGDAISADIEGWRRLLEAFAHQQPLNPDPILSRIVTGAVDVPA